MSENRPESIEKHLNYYLGSEYESVKKNFIMNNQLSIRYFNLFCPRFLSEVSPSSNLGQTEGLVGNSKPRYCKFASSSLSRLVAHFQKAYEGEI